MSSIGWWLAGVALGILLLGVAGPPPPSPSPQTTLHLNVPRQVAADAAARAAGRTAAPAPVLMLEGVTLDAGEGLTVLVLAPAPPGSAQPPQVLGTAGMVGQHEEPPSGAAGAAGAPGGAGAAGAAPSPEPATTLAVPLNDRAARLLAGKSSITLVLQVEGSPGRPPLQVKRAYFKTGP